jgi:hypothetical protein
MDDHFVKILRQGEKEELSTEGREDAFICYSGVPSLVTAKLIMYVTIILLIQRNIEVENIYRHVLTLVTLLIKIKSR